jgi:hypothetical protein
MRSQASRVATVDSAFSMQATSLFPFHTAPQDPHARESAYGRPGALLGHSILEGVDLPPSCLWEPGWGHSLAAELQVETPADWIAAPPPSVSCLEGETTSKHGVSPAHGLSATTVS